MGIMEKKMETTIMGPFPLAFSFRVCPSGSVCPPQNIPRVPRVLASRT